jgi:glutaredoxin 3
MMIQIITKDSCPWCVKAKTILKTHGYSYQEIKIPYSLSKEEFHTLVEEYQTSKTVPKIFDDKELIGGYEDLIIWLDNHIGGYGEGSLS